MPDINDVLNLPAPSQPQPQAPPASADVLSQLFGGTSYPQQPPQANGLQQLAQNVNNPLFTQDPATAYHKFINQIYYGNQDGSEPTRKQKILRPIEDFLESVIGYQRPELRMLPSAQQAYQEQTGRLGQQTGLEHWLGALFEQNRRNDIGLLNANTNAYRAQLTGQENQARDQARNLRNTIEQTYRTSQEQHLSAEDSELAVRKKVQEFQMANPGNPLQYAQVLTKAANAGDTSAMDDLNTILPIMLGLGVARNPLVSTGTQTTSTSTTSPTGVQTTTGQHNRIFPFMNGGGLPFIQNILRGINGGGSQGPQQTNPAAPPQANPGQPPATPPQPSAPQINGLNPPTLPIDPTNPRNPLNGPMGGKVASERFQNQSDITKDLLQIGNYGRNARTLSQNLLDSIGNGTAKNFTGIPNGHPLAIDIRSALGDVSPEESLLRGNLFESLYGKLKSSMKGRYNIPEISAATRMIGGQGQKASNLLMASTMLSLQADAQKLYETGQLDDSSQKSQMISRAVLGEMRRVQSLAKDPNAYTAAKQSGTDRVRNLDEILNTDFDKTGQPKKQVPIYKGGKQVGTVSQDQLSQAMTAGYSPKP